MSDKLAGKAVLVTGGGSGIGEACARLFGREGASVMIFDRSEPFARRTVETLQQLGVTATYHIGDVAVVSNCAAAVASTTSAFGRLDFLVNSAGVTSGAGWEMDESEWDRLIDTNLKGTFFSCQAALKEMVPRRYGRIVNLASIEGFIAVRSGDRSQPHYDAAKAGVVMITKALALDLAPHGIRVNAIAPGVIDTPLVAGLFKNEPDREARMLR